MARPKLSEENIQFSLCFSGSLKFMDASGIQYVSEKDHSNLSVFQVNDHILCIVEEGQYSKPEIFNALIQFHRSKINKEIIILKKIKKSLLL